MSQQGASPLSCVLGKQLKQYHDAPEGGRERTSNLLRRGTLCLKTAVQQLSMVSEMELWHRCGLRACVQEHGVSGFEADVVLYKADGVKLK